MRGRDVGSTGFRGRGTGRRCLTTELLIGTALVAISLTALDGGQALAQSALPPISIDAPKPRPRPVARPKPRPAAPREAAVARPSPVRAAVRARPVRAAVRARTAPAAARVPGPSPVASVSNGLPPATGTIGQPPPAYAGGQVATGARIGLLGNRDFLSTPFTQFGFTEKVIKDQQARTLEDVLLNDPSVRPSVSPYNYQSNFAIRGATLNGRDIAYDGLYGINGNRQPDLNGIERVEVLHGPGAFLFGFPPAGTVAGVVNLIPKRATDTPINEVGLFYLSKANVGTFVDVGRRYGDFNEFGVRINGTFQDGNTPIDRNSFSHGAVTAALDYRANDFRASTNFGYSNYDIQGLTGNFSVLPGVRIPRAPDLSRNQFQPYEFSHQSNVFGIARLEYDFAPDWTIFVGGGTSKQDEKFLQSIPAIANSAGRLNVTPLFSGGQEYQSTAEGGIRGQFDTGFLHHNVTVSANAYHLRYPFGSGNGVPFVSNLYDRVDVLPPLLNTINRARFDPASTYLYGVTAADTISLFDDKINLIGGVRQQYIDTTTFRNNPSVAKTINNQDALSPLGALVIKPTKEFSLYVSYAEGLSTGPTAPSTAVNANQIFPPVVTTQLEGGAKFDFGNIGASIAVFDLNLQSSFLDPVTRVFGVTGRQENRGAELFVFGTPVEGVRIIGGIAYVEGKLLRTVGGMNDGHDAIGAPRVQASFNAEYDIPFIPGLTATGRVIYTDRQFYDPANTQFIPAWTRFDLGARYTFTYDSRIVTTRFVVENIAGTNFWSSTNNGTIALGTPRTFKLSVSARF